MPNFMLDNHTPQHLINARLDFRGYEIIEKVPTKAKREQIDEFQTSLLSCPHLLAQRFITSSM